MSIRIKNWSNFQHFKDRRPPWIKLYRDILDDYDIALISDRSFRILINLWLLASEDRTGQGILPHIDAIAHRLRTKKEYIIKALDECETFLVQDDINRISEGYQDDAPETETETETEIEKRQRREEFNLFWDLYPRRNGKKVNKGDAQKEWLLLKPTSDLVSTIMEALRNQIDNKKRCDDKGVFCAEFPDAFRWLKKRRWNDEVTLIEERVANSDYDENGDIIYDDPEVVLFGKKS